MGYCILRSTKKTWPVARPRYEICVIKISVSPEKEKRFFFKLFPRAKKCSLTFFILYHCRETNPV